MQCPGKGSRLRPGDLPDRSAGTVRHPHRFSAYPPSSSGAAAAAEGAQTLTRRACDASHTIRSLRAGATALSKVADQALLVCGRVPQVTRMGKRPQRRRCDGAAGGHYFRRGDCSSGRGSSHQRSRHSWRASRAARGGALRSRDESVTHQHIGPSHSYRGTADRAPARETSWPEPSSS
jgi:hypothetical protein